MSKRVIEEHLKGTGWVKKEIIDNSTGKIIDCIEDHNLIVKIGRSTLINMIAGKIANTSITKIAIGSGGTADTGVNAFNPIPPVDNDTALKKKVTIKDLVSSEVNLTGTNPIATFVGIFDCDEVNSLINECGLFFKDATTMFARHTFDTVSLKSKSNFSLKITWTIEF